MSRRRQRRQHLSSSCEDSVCLQERWIQWVERGIRKKSIAGATPVGKSKKVHNSLYNNNGAFMKSQFPQLFTPKELSNSRDDTSARPFVEEVEEAKEVEDVALTTAAGHGTILAFIVQYTA